MPDDDVPVYDPLYPEMAKTCSHPSCDNRVSGADRLCEYCSVVMHRDTPDQCEYCGSSLTTQ